MKRQNLYKNKLFIIENKNFFENIFKYIFNIIIKIFILNVYY